MKKGEDAQEIEDHGENRAGGQGGGRGAGVAAGSVWVAAFSWFGAVMGFGFGVGTFD